MHIEVHYGGSVYKLTPNGSRPADSHMADAIDIIAKGGGALVLETDNGTAVFLLNSATQIVFVER